ncbi:hypothetical protein [Pseudomonas sp. GCEP-101]|uniref:hypothetical protein n=1 Tax=Pseudomonas sp. GCEP-101 TaxID=2974552 RepID=UPI00223A9961|nr:hypothetical protein [Pseudomonas sp. GCEP-101]
MVGVTDQLPLASAVVVRTSPVSLMVTVAVSADVGVQLTVFGHAVELAVHALGEEILDSQIRLFAALEEDFQVLAVTLDGDVLRRDIAAVHLQQVLGTRYRLDLAAVLDRNLLGCVLSDGD